LSHDHSKEEQRGYPGSLLMKLGLINNDDRYEQVTSLCVMGITSTILL